MAVADPYAACPCGSGQKFKWCCQKIEPFAERAQRLMENGQVQAAIEALDEGLRKEPDNPLLLTRQAVYLLQSGEVERGQGAAPPGDPEAAAPSRGAVAPDAPRARDRGAPGGRCAAPAGAGGGRRTRAEGARGAGADRRLVPGRGGPLPGGARAPGARGSGSIPTGPGRPARRCARSRATRRSRPGRRTRTASRRPRTTCRRRSGHGSPRRWGGPARVSGPRPPSAFELLAADGAGPEAERNLGLCRLWLGDYAAAAPALRRSIAQAGAAPEAVDLEALCQQIAPLGPDDTVEQVQWIWPLRDSRTLLETLRGDPTIHEEETAPIDPEDPESPEVIQFALLAGPKIEAARGLSVDQIPRIVGRVLVGQEIVALEGIDDGRLDALSERFTTLAGSTIAPAHPKTKVLGSLPRSSVALTCEWLFPEGIDRDEIDRLSREQGAVIFRDVWPKTPLPYLRGRTPAAAAAAGDAEVPLRAAVFQLEQSLEPWRDERRFRGLAGVVEDPPRTADRPRDGRSRAAPPRPARPRPRRPPERRAAYRLLRVAPAARCSRAPWSRRRARCSRARTSRRWRGSSRW